MEIGAPVPIQVPLSVASYRSAVEEFLCRMGLRLENALEYYAVLHDERGAIIGGGGFEGNTIKCIAADPDARGMGLTNILISHLRSEMTARGVQNIFVFTKPSNLEIFESLAFSLVGSAPKAILMESSRRGAKSLERTLSAHKKEGINGAIVMNCNPFTLGHLYLIEKAAGMCDNLFIFPVRADRSVFPYDDRLMLIKDGTAHLKNVEILDGGEYIISQATFPTYFLKEMSEASVTYAMLDVDIFARHIVPPLGINIRFAGSEPLDPLTNEYNRAMKTVLEPRGIEVKVIERYELGGKPVSASRVRALIKEGLIEKTKELLPEITYSYLMSPRGQAAVVRLREHI